MIDFRVTPDSGEPYEVTATSRDVLMWERTGKGRSFNRLMENMSFVDLFHLAWVASRRTGHIDTTVTLADFEAGNDIEPISKPEDEEEDPTTPAPSTGSA